MRTTLDPPDSSFKEEKTLPVGIPRVPDAPLHPAKTNAELTAILEAEDFAEHTRVIAQSSITE